MNKAVLITGNRKLGLRELAASIAWNYDPSEKGVITTNWNYRNFENFEQHPAFWADFRPSATVLIFHGLPNFFEYNRLMFLLTIGQFEFVGTEEQNTISVPPQFIFTSIFHPVVEDNLLKHIKIT